MHTAPGWREPWSFADSGTPSGPPSSVAAILPERPGDPQRRNQSGMMMTVVGEIPAILKTLEQVRQVAATDSTVLLLGENRHRQGALCHAPSMHNARRSRRALVRVRTAAPFTDTSSRASCSATRRAPSPAPSSDKAGRFERRRPRDHLPRRDRRAVAGRCRSSCCACCRSGSSSPWAAPQRIRSTCASSPPRNRELEQRWRSRRVPRGPVLSAQRHSPSRCRRCASASKTSRCSSTTSSASSPGRPSGKRLDPVRRQLAALQRYAGRATSASCGTSSSGR